MGDGQKANWKDIIFKVFWTAVSVSLAALGTEIAEVDAIWVPIATPAINVALAWVRQQLGATPPEAPTTAIS